MKLLIECKGKHVKNKPKCKQNELSIDLESIEVQTISTSKNVNNNEYIKMFIISFKMGNEKITQTRHMTDSQMDAYREAPSIDKVSYAGKGRGYKIRTST